MGLAGYGYHALAWRL